MIYLIRPQSAQATRGLDLFAYRFNAVILGALLFGSLKHACRMYFLHLGVIL